MPHFAEAFEVVAARENPHHAACASVAARLQIQSRIPYYYLVITHNSKTHRKKLRLIVVRRR